MRLFRAALRLFAHLLWDTLSAAARLGLHFVSASANERSAQEQLRGEFRAIAAAEGQETAMAGSGWQRNRLRLRRNVLAHDARGFLTWGVIRETMFPPPYAAFARSELKFLKCHDWQTWRKAIREIRAGTPLPSMFCPWSSTNAIHHAYHLCRFELETAVKIREVAAIFEFGGGYGSLCRVVHALGFKGRYRIFDLPEQAALQRYYLRAAGVEGVLTISSPERLGEIQGSFGGDARLFIATWSLSESPLELRQRMAEAVRDFDAFLIAYQSVFEGVDNEAFFAKWTAWFPEVRWMRRKLESLPESTYLFGVRR